MSISKVPSGSFGKYNVVTGSGTYNLPKEDVGAVYGPGWPIAPITRPEDSELPREIDYPVAVNATLQPRVGYEGLMPINALRAAYSNVVEVSTPVGLIIRELSGFVPMLKDRKTKQRISEDHPYTWMTRYPDRVTPFNVWISRFKKSAKIYAAPAFFMRKDGKGSVDALEYIDGSTLFLIVNTRGKLPEPDEVDADVLKYIDRIKYGINNSDPRVLTNMPEVARKYLENARKRIQQGKSLPITTPAFTQIIKGIPFSFWDKSQIYFVPEPPAPSVDSPYGETYIERSWSWIQLIALISAFEIGHYRTGNMPEGFAAMPKEWFPTMTKLAMAEKEFNARMATGSQTQHARIRFGPEGMKYIPTKKPDFPDKLYSTARHNIFYALGVPTSEIGERSSRGLGGKGFEQGAAHDMTRQILETEKRSIEQAFNQVLERDGVDDAVFYLDYPQEEIDPSIQQESLWNQLIHGTMTMNDVLTAQNKSVIGDINDKNNIANLHLLVTGSSVYVIEKMVADETGLIAPQTQSVPESGGSPAGIEDAITNIKPHTPEDMKTVEKLFKQAELNEGSNIGTTTYSLPPVAKSHARDKCFNCSKPPTKDVSYAMAFGRIWLCDEHFKEFKSKQKHKIYVHDINGVAPEKWADSSKKMDMSSPYEQPAVPPEGISEEEWQAGMAEEQEHINSVDGDQSLIASIVMDHLKEDPYYYTHNKMVSKINGPIAAGLAVKAVDTGRILMLQRSWEESDPAAGTWEFPGGHVEEGEDPLTSAKREWCEETGMALPEGKVISEWVSFDGKYCGYVYVIDREASLDIHGDRDEAINPDDPDGDKTESLAWWEVKQLRGNPSVRSELRNSVSHVERALSQRIMEKISWPEYYKHCGVCDGDDAYFGSPISRKIGFEHDLGVGHANETEIVAMVPEGKPPLPAIWKPEGGENTNIQEAIGGPQYVREEAAWLVAQSLNFPLVPMAYVSEHEEESGAVVWHAGNNEPRPDLSSYDGGCIEEAAVLDYIIGQRDRGSNHNYLTHPTNPMKVVLIDNGFSLSDNPDHFARSIFCNHMEKKLLSDKALDSIGMCLNDQATWKDIQSALSNGGNQENARKAVELARNRAQLLLDNKCIKF